MIHFYLTQRIHGALKLFFCFYLSLIYFVDFPYFSHKRKTPETGRLKFSLFQHLAVRRVLVLIQVSESVVENKVFSSHEPTCSSPFPYGHQKAKSLNRTMFDLGICWWPVRGLSLRSKKKVSRIDARIFPNPMGSSDGSTQQKSTGAIPVLFAGDP